MTSDRAMEMIQELLEAGMELQNESSKSHNHIPAEVQAAKQRCVQASAALFQALTKEGN